MSHWCQASAVPGCVPILMNPEFDAALDRCSCATHWMSSPGSAELWYTGIWQSLFLFFFFFCRFASVVWHRQDSDRVQSVAQGTWVQRKKFDVILWFLVDRYRRTKPPKPDASQFVVPARLPKINLFAGRAVKRERRKGSSRRQQPAYGAAVNEVAHELLRSARSPKRENGGRRYIKHDGMIASPVGSCLCCWQLPLSPPVPPLYCSTPHCPSISPTRFDAFKDVIVSIVHNMLPILSEQPRHLGYRPVYVGFPYDL